jgi:plasmid stability protein
MVYMARRHDTICATRLDHQLAAAIRHKAEAHDRTVSGEIRRAVRLYVENENGDGLSPEAAAEKSPVEVASDNSG